MTQLTEKTVWKSNDGRRILADLCDGKVWVSIDCYERHQIDELIEALEDARDLMDAEKAKTETKETLDRAILAGSVC